VIGFLKNPSQFLDIPKINHGLAKFDIPTKTNHFLGEATTLKM
jgi:hypothetical protein